MYIEAVPNRNSPPAILLRESYRVDGKVKKRTLLNLSDWPPDLIEGFRALLKGGTALPPGQDAIVIKRSLPHGHVAAVLGTLRKIGLDRLLGPMGNAPNRCRDQVIAMIAVRLIAPTSKRGAATALDPITAASSLGEVLGLRPLEEDELYTALNWLLERQSQVEAALVRRHLKGGTLVLYDVSSSYFEGRCCPLAQFGFNRDGKRGKLQIVYGLLCTPDGCPVAIEVFEGSTGDPTTLAAQIDKLKQRFELSHVVLVGDRGMITQACIEEDIKPAGLDWITALPASQIRALVDSGIFRLSVFDKRDLVSITADDYPDERLIVCRNPELALARRRKREYLLAATERDLAEIQNRVRRTEKPLRGTAKIALKAAAVVGKYKMAKHFTLTITDDDFSFARKQDAIDAEARLDGIYVVRTNLKAPTLDDSATVRAYKSLAQVERAIRRIKTVDLHIRPLLHWTPSRVRAHVFLCMLAYHVERHLRQRLAPMLYDDADKATSVVAKTQRSPSAIAKQTHGVPPDGFPVRSLQTLLADLATLARNTVTTALNPDHEFVVHTRPTKLQQKALDLLAINPATCMTAGWRPCSIGPGLCGSLAIPRPRSLTRTRRSRSLARPRSPG